MPDFLAYLPIAPPGENPWESTASLVAFLVFVVIMAVVVWWYWRRQFDRHPYFENLAKERGWEFQPEGEDVTTEPFGRLPLFYKAHQIKLKPRVISRKGTHHMQMGDFAFMSAARFWMMVMQGARWHQTIALARCRNQRLPLFVVAPAKRSVVEPYTPQKFKRIRFKDRPEAEVFQKKAVLLTRRPELVHELFAGDRLADFIETIVKPLLESRLVLEAGGGWILVYESNGLASREELPWLWEFAEKTADYFHPQMADAGKPPL